MNGKTRKKLYAIIAERDGEYCLGCQALPSERQLIVDHIDNNQLNNNLENLQLLCRTCNFNKNPRGAERPLDLCVRSEPSRYAAISTNRVKEPLFRGYVYEKLDSDGSLDYKELIYSGAEEVGISPATAKRYLDKMCSKEGKLEKYGRRFSIYDRLHPYVKYKTVKQEEIEL